MRKMKEKGNGLRAALPRAGPQISIKLFLDSSLVYFRPFLISLPGEKETGTLGVNPERIQKPQSAA